MRKNQISQILKGDFFTYQEYLQTSGWQHKHRYDRIVRTWFSLFQVIIYDKGVLDSVIKPVLEISPGLMSLFIFVYGLGNLCLLNVLAGPNSSVDILEKIYSGILRYRFVLLGGPCVHKEY